MSDPHRDVSLIEYYERCGCGRIVITPRQAQAHQSRCGEMPAESDLLASYEIDP